MPAVALITSTAPRIQKRNSRLGARPVVMLKRRRNHDAPSVTMLTGQTQLQNTRPPMSA